MTVIITSEILSVVYLLVIIVASLATRRGKTSTTAKCFLLSAAATALGALADALAYQFNKTEGIDGLLYVFNLLAIVGCDLAIVPFAYYVLSMISERKKVSPWFAHAVTIVAGMETVLILVGSFTGSVFSIENGVFVPGMLFGYCGMPLIAMLLYYFIFALSQKKAIGSQAVFVTGIYLVLPTVTAIHGWINDTESYAYVAMALVMMIMFVSLQAVELEKGRTREKIMQDVSQTDVLTGLNNRRAYEVVLNEIGKDTPVGVCFCDLNGLKRVNDHFGHAAGDDMILRFAELLRDSFPATELFRISGDEFVVLEPNATNDFARRVAELKESARVADRLASVGFCYGAGGQILTLIRDAEKEMYNEKNAYYVEMGIDRRK